MDLGTVCTVGDDGSLDVNDPQSVCTAPDGVTADVYLATAGAAVPCRVALGVGGDGAQVIAPVKPGDEVVVLIAGGNMQLPPTIVAVLNNNFNRAPLDSSGKPLFKNDRLLVWSKSGQFVEICNDDIRLVDETADQAFVRGNDYLSAESSFLTQMKTFITALDVYAAAIQSIADPSGSATSALSTAITTFQAAIEQFADGSYLSKNVRGK